MDAYRKLRAFVASYFDQYDDLKSITFAFKKYDDEEIINARGVLVNYMERYHFGSHTEKATLTYLRCALRGDLLRAAETCQQVKPILENLKDLLDDREAAFKLANPLVEIFDVVEDNLEEIEEIASPFQWMTERTLDVPPDIAEPAGGLTGVLHVTFFQDRDRVRLSIPYNADVEWTLSLS